MLENDADPTEPQRGWSRCLEVQHFRRDVWPTLTDPNQALLRLQAPSVSSFDRFAYQPGDPNRPTTFPSVVVQTPLSPTSVDLAHLPMWPPYVCVATIAWSGRQLRCAGRQADALVWTGSSEIWTWELLTIWMHAASRSSLTGCAFGMVRSWLWIQLSCHPCMEHSNLERCVFAGSTQVVGPRRPQISSTP